MFGALFEGVLGEIGAELVKLAALFLVSKKAREHALEAHHRKYIAPAPPPAAVRVPPRSGRPAGRGLESVTKGER